MTSKIIVNNIESDTGVSTVTISSPVNLSGGITGGGFSVGTGASISSPATNVLTISTNNSERIRVGAAGSIGIGTDNPTKFIDITGVHSGINTTGRFVMSPHSSGWDTGVTSGNIHHHYIDNFRLYSGQIGSGTERFKVDSAGRVTMPYQPAFFAYPNTNTSLGANTTLILPNTQFNIGSHYNTSTGRFTAPVAGVYHFSFGAQHNASVNDNIYLDLHVNGAHYSSAVRAEMFTSSTFHVVNASATIYMNASDYATIYMAGTGWGDNTWFSGHLVG
jgi:hypothetical protein